jgi:APA family basic amino acid/polyamine antiporter
MSPSDRPAKTARPGRPAPAAGAGRSRGGAATLRLREIAHPPRVWSPLDAFLYNVMTTNVAVTFGILLLAGAAFYFPVRSMTVAVLIAGGFCISEAVVYAFLISSMPRNGGDYIFQRGLLSGRVGALFSFSGVVVGGTLWMAIAGWFASRVAVGPFLILLGQSTHAQGLTQAGRWVLTPAGLIVFGLVAVAWSAALNLFGMRAYARLQRILVFAGGIAVIVLVTYFALTRLDTYNSAYSEILLRAYYDGFQRSGHAAGLGAAIQLLPIVSFGLIYPGWIAFQAAEVKRVSSLRVQSLTIVLAKVVSVGFALVLLPLPISHMGEELFGASAFLAVHDPAAFWVLAPRLFSTSAAPWLAWVTLFSLAIAANAWFWLWVPNHTLAASRVLLAMSWDRRLPRWLSRLGARHGAPVPAIVSFSVLSASLVLFAYRLGIWRLLVSAALVNLITFGVTCLAAALFPFSRRELYRESTAAPYELAGIPLISVTGLAFAAFAAYVSWRYVRFQPLKQTNGAGTTLLMLAVLYGAPALALLAYRWYRGAHEGADIDVYFEDVGRRAAADV